MRRWSRVLSVLLALALLVPGFAGSVEGAQPPPKKLPSAKFDLAPGQAKKLSLDEASLEAGPDAVSEKTTISITALNEQELPPLDPGMVNVTKGPRRGYRFLPHMQFRANLKVSLPYDRALIPPGYTEEDIQTFYFDEAAGVWKPLELEATDTAAQLISSLTDHFTDMINAVVTVPDSPGLQGGDPNAMADVETAHPGEGITLIDAPRINNTGDAILTYPLELPPGRDGMQPEVDLHYSSAAGNGWLGVGWNLTVPDISVDTRWGVPRYSPATETESYILAGEALTPLAHRGTVEARTADKVFHQRAEGTFQRIVRHGDHPASYWWEVTDQSGTRFLYGDDATGTHTLRDGAGNIYRWALRQVIDLNGNTIDYSYDRATSTGVAGGTVPGTELYLRSINYTGWNGEPGPYTVAFGREGRPDVLIDARGGFKQVTADRLKRITITLNGELVRQYELSYSTSTFGKSLLTAVTQLGEDGSEFFTHGFDYYQEPAGFAAPVTWDAGSDSISGPLIPFGGSSAISGSVSTGGGGHAYIGFNPTSPTKANSIGGKVGFNYTENDGVLELIDINGDNLPDKVFKSGDSIYYRPNLSGTGSTGQFGLPKPLDTLPELSTEQSFLISGGAEAYPGAVSIFLNQSEVFTNSSTYLADVNSDGLPDLVSGGQVLFGYRQADGTLAYSYDSSATPVPVGAGAVDANGVIPDFEAIYQQQIDGSPLYDTLRRWTAPFDGTVRISGDVALVQDTSDARSQYRTADGVRVAIQQNGSELWSATMGPDDYAPRTPAGVEGVAVQKGDRIYFRVQSVFDGAYDQVSWDPVISYVGQSPTYDVNGLDVYRYQASMDYVLAGRPSVAVGMPYSGTVRLTGRVRKTSATSDDVTLQVKVNGSPVISQLLAGGDTADFTLDEPLSVNQGDLLQLQMLIDSPVDLRTLSWEPLLYYTAATNSGGQPVPVQDAGGTYLIQVNPPFDMSMYPVSSLTQPQAAWEAPQSGTLSVAPGLAAFGFDANGTVTFTVKRAGQLLAKRTLTVTGGAVSGVDAFGVEVTEGDQLYFDFSSGDPELTQRLLGHSATVVYGDEDPVTVPTALHSAVAQGVFGQPYRGWAYAGYNGNRDRAAQPIDESRLVLNAADYRSDCNPGAITEPEDLAGSTCKPDQDKAFAFAPSPTAGTWTGSARRAWVSGTHMSSSRLGATYITVPRPGQFAGARAVGKVSRTSQTAVGGGVSIVSGSVSGDPLAGSSWADVDYLDLNGDGFPDIIGNGEVQYTTPDGGLESSSVNVSGLSDTVRESTSFAYNVGVGGSPAHFRADSGGSVASDASGNSPKGSKTGSQMVELGLTGELGGGWSDVDSDLVDINGDGLPDQVSRSGSQLMVALNLGYSFAAAEPWGSAAISEGAARNYSLGVSVGFNAGDYSFAGGASLGKGESLAGCTVANPFTGDCDSAGQVLADLNGDGLPDRVSPDGSSLKVAFNTGAGFGPELDWGGSLADAVAKSGDITLGGGAYFTIGIGPLCEVGCYIIINPGFDVSQTMNRQELTLLDVDGDGYADHVASDDNGQLTVARNQVGRTHLLKTVRQPMGSSISLEYRRDGNTYADPISRWVLSQVTVADGHPGDGADTRVTTYRYEGGAYDRLEREFYGYSRVIEEHRDSASGNALYRSIIRDYRNDSFYSRGILVRERLQDAAGNPYTETEHTYDFRLVAGGGEANLQSTTESIFPRLLRTDQRYFEGQVAATKSTYVSYEYDGLGRMTSMTESGDVGAQDDLLVTFTYTDCTQTYLLNQATSVVMTDEQGNELRRRDATIDCATGNLEQVRESIDAATAAVTDMSYYPNGNLREMIHPANQQGQRYTLTYEYDDVTATHVTAVTDSFGYRSTATYNLKHGTEASATDINGNTTSYDFDVYGRLAGVTGPYEQGAGTATIRFEYHPHDAVPWALTRRADPYRNPADPIDTVTFSDGLGRVVQTKQDATVHTSQDTEPQGMMTVSGRVMLDLAGRPAAEYYPVTEPLGTPGLYNPTLDTVAPTVLTYDVLDRTTATTLPDGTANQFRFGFGPDRDGITRFMTTVIDPNGVVKEMYRDTAKRMTALKEFNQDGAEVIWTSYDYDPLGQLTAVTDDQGNVTRTGYDRKGRRTSVESPDAGLTEYRYDLAGNLVAEETPTLRVAGQAITYRYDFNRLTEVLHPNFPETNVRYFYGAPGAPDNRAGEITRVEDQSGSEERYYGKLGEVTRTVKTVASETQGNSPHSPEVYTTQFEYDSFARLQRLTYPDGEVLTYGYDSGGLLRAADGAKAGHTYSYIRRYEYDKFGQPAFLETGNHIRTRYGYNPQNRLLTSLKAGKGEGNLFQDLSYTYDYVGNILSISNNVPVPPPSQFGGPSTQQFTYDDLYRLTTAEGTYQFNPDKSQRYTLNLSYDSIHNITAKTQTDEIVQPSGSVIPQHKTSYTWSYSYGDLPHAATHIGDRTFQYDESGNQLGWTDDQNGTRRTIIWDDAGRIQSISDNGQTMTYKYNDQGERVMKRGPQGETVYVNPYFTVRNRERGTKHIWAGGMQLASKLVKQPRSGEVSTDGDAPVEKDLYFYHADHHGSSGYVTDNRGKPYEHTEYFPFGEVWVQEKSNTQRTPYLFTGKELDEETGLFYFGARYYDPQTSLWQSADPALNDYLSGQESGGVYSPANLQLYGYAHQNPMINIDPDGRAKYRVSYFKSKYAERARAYRVAFKTGGRNVATLAYRDAGGTKRYKTMISWGKHSEKRLYDWYQANCAGCTVRWLYTELAPCGSDVHSCNARVKQWWGNNITVYYSIAYPNSHKINAVSSITGAARSAAVRSTIAKTRRHKAVLLLKRWDRELNRRQTQGISLSKKWKPLKGGWPEVDESDDELGYEH